MPRTSRTFTTNCRWPAAALSAAFATMVIFVPATPAQEPAVAPPIAQPEAPPPPVRPPALPSVAGQAGPATEPVITGPLSVEEAVALAQHHNPLIAFGERGVAKAAAEVGSARAMTRPWLSITAYETTGNLAKMFADPAGVEPRDMSMVPTGSYSNASLRALLPLYTGGKLRSIVRRAQALYQAAGADLATLRLNVALDARVRYYQALQAEDLAKVYEQVVATEEENVRVARDLYEQGKIALFDVLRAQTELANAIQQLTSARNAHEAALVSLKATLGVDLSSTPELIATEVSSVALPPLAGLLREAEARRPELAALNERVTAARQSARAARAAYRPQIYAVGAEDFFSGTDISSGNGAAVGVVASLPILDGGARRSAVRAAEAQADREQAARHSMRLQVREEVVTAWLRTQTEQQNVITSQTALAQAEEDYRIATERYRAGKSIIVELYDVLTALVKAQTNAVNARHDLTIAHAELQRAIGRQEGVSSPRILPGRALAHDSKSSGVE